MLSIFKDTEPRNKMDANKEVISRLKFISRINKSEKINVRTAYFFVQQDDLPTRLSRTFYNKDNRGNALNFIRDTVERSFMIISSHISSDRPSERLMCINIMGDLKKAKNGISNLKETYITDIMFCCEMDTILQEIDAKLEELAKGEYCEEKEDAEEMP